MALINCDECGKEISEKATTCPNCGNTLKKVSYEKKPKKPSGCLKFFLIFFVVIFIVIVAGIVGTNLMNDEIQKSISGVATSDEYITLDAYNKIETGMTYEEVVEIIGSNGVETSTVTSNDITISIYTWYGNGVAGSNANVTFTNDEATAKAQVGLK